MKQGTRIFGIAESYTSETSTLAGVVTTAAGRLEEISIGQCTVGGVDATDTIATVIERVDRPDVGAVLIAGVAPAWFNIINLEGLARRIDRPIIAVSFEESNGLKAAIKREFEPIVAQDRMKRYDALPSRRRFSADPPIYFHASGCDRETAEDILATVTPEGQPRPEPLRLAKVVARGVDGYRSRRD